MNGSMKNGLSSGSGFGWVCGIILPLALLSCTAGNRAELALPESEFDAVVDSLITSYGSAVSVSVWIGGTGPTPWYQRNADVSLASASAIKTSYLVELFNRFEGRLDEPMASVDAVVNDPTHGAVIHFDPETQAEIARDLSGATVRFVGRAMIRGTGVSNAVYNAAANVTTAEFGGPSGLTEAVHQRTPEFEGLSVRRYMLARRDVTGDNTATAASLAHVLRRVAGGNLPGTSPETTEAIREILRLDEENDLGEHYYKSGGLSSDPAVAIRSGYFMKEGAPLVYVVMVEQPLDADGGGAAGIAAFALDLATALLIPTDRALHGGGAS